MAAILVFRPRDNGDRARTDFFVIIWSREIFCNKIRLSWVVSTIFGFFGPTYYTEVQK